MRRKLFFISIILTAGVVLMGLGTVLFLVPLAAAGVFSVFMKGMPEGGPDKKWVCIFLAVYAAGGILARIQTASIDAGKALDREQASFVRARVVNVEKYNEEKCRFECVILSVDEAAGASGQDSEDHAGTGQALSAGARSGEDGPKNLYDAGKEKFRLYHTQRVLVSCYKKTADPQTLIGRVITFTGCLQEPDTAGNPRCFDYRQYLLSRGIGHTASVKAFEVSGQPARGLLKYKGKISVFREQFMDRLSCSEETRSLIRGVLFGDTRSMDEEMQDDFRANGTAHVLAVSGLHIGVIYGLYRMITKRRKSAFITAGFILFLLFYGTITLWSVSVTRAVMLVLIVTAGNSMDRRSDLLTSLGLIAIILLVRNPRAVYSVSFQMSFLAVASIAFFQPFLARKLPEGLAAMLAVQIGIVPYTMYMFNNIPLIAILCNIPVIYILSFLVPSGIAALVLFPLSAAMPLSGLFHLSESALSGLSGLLIRINGILAHGGLFSLSVPSPPLGLIILFYGAAFFFVSEFFQIYYKRGNYDLLTKCFLVIFLISAVSFTADRTPFDKAQIVMADVGQGDCLHVKAGRHTDLLFDGGGSTDYNIGKKTLRPYLLRNRITDVDLACATHLHTDHYQGLKELDECFDVKKLLTKGKAGDRYVVSRDCYFDILWPEEQDPDTDDENKNSLIFKIYKDGVTILVTGDISSEGEAALIKKYEGTDTLKCDILKVAHHGSKYSSSDAFLDAVSPRLALIGVGARNTFGHPTKEALDRLGSRGIPVYRTDLDGAIGVIIDKGNLRVCTNKPRDVS